MNVCKVFQNMIFYQWKKNKGSYSAGMHICCAQRAEQLQIKRLQEGAGNE